MSTQRSPQLTYGFTKTIDVPYEEAIEKVRAALAKEGFGVLTQIDLKDKFKEKLGVDFRPYVILGACNPALAYESLQQEMEIGLLLPCNVIVYEQDGRTVVSAVDAGKMMSVVGNRNLESTAGVVNEKLRRVINDL
ncbi:MAG TPA: DUF302 domain-containing protein [Pyrinomonadaceae bacterium]|nr:DUF302 domain-containing protein [Pyrinomonadaceae bacterium]